MMNIKDIIKEKIRQHKIIAIARGISDEHLIPAAKALKEGGIRFIEVTFDHTLEDPVSPTVKKIKLLAENFGDELFIGAGTVLSLNEVRAACEAGARFIISPDLNEEIIQATLELGIVSIPGALTPTEIQKAHRVGADFVKVFPAGDLGSGYLKSVLSPLKHIEMMAVGGIDCDNLAEFISAGAKCAGVGSNLVRKDLIVQSRFTELTELAKKYCCQIQR
jgi:2-dehydro-3-deoxyphosphogluconate aldolase/(4S)-4-hydroxy-2-oxoglutarate aldolase